MARPKNKSYDESPFSLSMEDNTSRAKMPSYKKKEVVQDAYELFIKCQTDTVNESIKCQAITALFEALEFYSEDECKDLYKALNYDANQYSALTTIKKALNISEEEYLKLLSSHNTLKAKLAQLNKAALLDRLDVIKNQLNKGGDDKAIKILKDKQDIILKALDVELKQEESGDGKVPVTEMSQFFNKKIWANKDAITLIVQEAMKIVIENIIIKLDNTMERDDNTSRVKNLNYNITEHCHIRDFYVLPNGERRDVTNDIEREGYYEFFLSEANLEVASEAVTRYLEYKLFTEDNVIS